MELRHLRYFIAVAEESTLIAAAKRLRVAQPALTRQIHDLERDIGVDLFERGPRGVELTPAGEVCLVSARHILRQVETAIERARGSSRGIVGRCRICVGARSLASGLIARIVAQVHAEYPAIELVVTEGVGFRQWNSIQQGEMDIGLGFPANKDYPDLASETLDYDIFDAILVSSTHRVASRASVSLGDMTEDTFLAWKSKLLPDFIRQQKTEFARVGFTPARTREFEDIFSIAAMVAAGQGWTLFPTSNSALAVSGSTIVPLDGFKLPIPHAVVSRRAEQQPVVRTVLAIIRRVMTAERATTLSGPAIPSDSLVPPPLEGASVDDAADEPAGERAIELRHLRYFFGVVESKSFGRAAERLELTQPALSRQIRDLERTVGVDLLERAARGATTTPAGESFFASTRRILDEANALPAEAQRARRGMVARCVLGAVSTSGAHGLLNDLIRRSAQELPHLEIFVEDYHTPMQPAALRSAVIDLGLCHASPLSPVEERGLIREPLVTDVVNCALVAADGPLADQSSLSFGDLVDVPFLFPNRAFQPGLYDLLFSMFDDRSFRPRIDQSYQGLKTIWTMIAEGRGWGVGFQSQCSDPPPGTIAVPVIGFAMPWGLDVLYRDDESRTPILILIDMLHDIARVHEQQSAVA
ncbi:MAG: LysR family transcriptional regulator [bacterium]